MGAREANRIGINRRLMNTVMMMEVMMMSMGGADENLDIMKLSRQELISN